MDGNARKYALLLVLLHPGCPRWYGMYRPGGLWYMPYAESERGTRERAGGPGWRLGVETLCQECQDWLDDRVRGTE